MKVPIFYAYLHAMLQRGMDYEHKIHIKEAKIILSKYRIPTILQLPILKEMQAYNLIKFLKCGKKEILIKENKYLISQSKERVVLNFEM